MDNSLTITRTLKAPRERVFEAWTTKEDLVQWFSPENMITEVRAFDAKVGGTFEVVMKAPDGSEYVAGGTFKEVVAPEKLVFTWKWIGTDDAHESLITVTLKENGDETEMHFVHENLESEESVKQHTEGWESTFNKLEKVLA